MISKANEDPLAAKANAAFEQAAYDVIARARTAKTELVVWRNGKVVKLSPDQAEQQCAERTAISGTETAE